MKGLAARIEKFVVGEPRLALARALARDSGCRLFLVGGVIRDLALGRPIVDLDFVLDGPGRRFLRELSGALGRRVVTFRKRGTVDHRIAAGDREWDFVERGRRPMRAELLRRDFTLNAVAWDLEAGRLFDPARGASDLARRTIRATGAGIFKDDPLRMLRAVRLRAEIPGLALERRTAALIAGHAPLIRRVSAERIKSELDRILSACAPSRSIRLLEGLGLFAQLLPELDPLRGLRQNRYHHLDAFRHTIEALAAADRIRALARGLGSLVFMPDPSPELPAAAQRPASARGGRGHGPVRPPAPAAKRPAPPRELPPQRARLLRWALLLHDTGKAETRTLGEDGDYHFYLHERASARISRQVLQRLRASRGETAEVERLVALHLRLSIPASGGLTPRARRRIVRDAGHLTPLLVLHSIADKAASRGAGHARALAAIRRAGRDLLETWKQETERSRREPRFLSGHDIMKVLGIPPGPAVGALLEELDERQSSRTIRSRPEALAWLRRRRPPGS